MLLIKNGRFCAEGASFCLPNGVYLETDPATPHEYGVTVWEEKNDLLIDIYVDEDDDPLSSLQGLLEDDEEFIPYSPIAKIEMNGLKGYEAFYHDKTLDYYECRLVISEDTSVTFFAQYPKHSVSNPKDLPEIRVILESIRKE